MNLKLYLKLRNKFEKGNEEFDLSIINWMFYILLYRIVFC